MDDNGPRTNGLMMVVVVVGKRRKVRRDETRAEQRRNEVGVTKERGPVRAGSCQARQ